MRTRRSDGCPFKPLFIIASAALAGACQSISAGTPAALASADAETVAQVKTVLAQAMGRARIEIGTEDLTTTSVISVLPPPLSAHEDRSPATPTHFDLVVKNGVCYAVKRDSGEAHELQNIACRPLNR